MATDIIYKGGSAKMDCDDLALTGGLSVAGAAVITGAATISGGILGMGTIVNTTGTAPTIPAGCSMFLGSKNSSNVVLPNAATYPGALLYVAEAGTGTMTLTGYGSQTWNGAGTGTITPGKNITLQSDGDNWRAIYANL